MLFTDVVLHKTQYTWFLLLLNVIICTDGQWLIFGRDAVIEWLIVENIYPPVYYDWIFLSILNVVINTQIPFFVC